MASKSERTERISKALEQIRKKNGGKITPRMVVDAARSDKHPLHDEFDWNDTTAAQKYREDVARGLIRYVVQETTTERRSFKVVAYVRDPEAKSNEQGYIALTAKDLERESAEKIMLTELGRCESAIERARDVVAVLEKTNPGIAERLEIMLQEIVGLRETLARAA